MFKKWSILFNQKLAFVLTLNFVKNLSVSLTDFGKNNKCKRKEGRREREGEGERKEERGKEERKEEK